MRLTELAALMGKDPSEVLTLIMRMPSPVIEQVDFTGDIYGMRISPHMVEAVREFILKETAQEVIDHVKENGTGKISSGPYWDDPEDEDD